MWWQGHLQFCLYFWRQEINNFQYCNIFYCYSIHLFVRVIKRIQGYFDDMWLSFVIRSGKKANKIRFRRKKIKNYCHAGAKYWISFYVYKEQLLSFNKSEQADAIILHIPLDYVRLSVHVWTRCKLRIFETSQFPQAYILYPLTS